MKLLTLEVYNRILNLFNLVLTDIGLFYVHKLRFGEIKYFVTNDIDKVISFLGLPYKPDNSIESLYYAVTNSDYFQVEAFTKYREGSDKFKEFVKYLKKQSPASFYRPVYLNNWGAIKTDVFFGTNLLKKILLLGPSLGLTSKSLKNKFNGHLVQKWTGLTRGPVVAETIQEFKEHVSHIFECSFLDYINSRPPRIIKSDFQAFYNDFPIVDSVPF